MKEKVSPFYFVKSNHCSYAVCSVDDRDFMNGMEANVS